MAVHDHITAEQVDLIASSRVFFTASVHPELTGGPGGEGPVNLSPKGMTPLHVLDSNRVAYLDFPGSGNETARHADASGPITLMVMSLEGANAGIVRLYGRARRLPIEGYADAERLLAGAPSAPRQVVEVAIDRTQTSCGYGVPVFDFVGPRPRTGRGRRFKEPRSSD